MKNIRWNIVIYTLLGIAALVGMGMLMSLISKKDSAQVVSSLKVIIEGKETFIDQEDISRIIKNEFGSIVGQTLQEVKLNEIERSIKKLPYVSNAEIFMDLDGLVQINIQQREVVLRVVNQAGREFYVDTKGNKIPVTLKYVPHVLIANGFINEGYNKPLEPVKTDLIGGLVKLVEHIKDDELWSNQVVQIYVNNEHDIELIPRVGNEVLVLGSADSLDYKLERLKIYYQNILPKVGANAYSRVNVKYGGQIICERRGDWFIDSLQMKINMKN